TIPRPTFNTFATVNEQLSLSGTGAGNNGALDISAGASLGDSVIWAGNITLAADSSIKTEGRDLIVSGTVAGGGGLTKEGAGTLELKLANSFAGPLAVNGGTLRFDSIAGLGPNTSPVQVAGGAKLFGVGNFNVSRPVELAEKAT